MYRKKEKNKFNLFGLIVIYFITILSIGLAYSFCNTKLSLTGKTSVRGSSTLYSYTSLLNSKWQTGGVYYYHYTIDVKYLGTKDAIKWISYIKTPMDAVLDAFYNGENGKIENSVFSMSNASYNGNITPSNNTFSFGFQIHTSDPNYELNLLNIIFSEEEIPEEVKEDLANNPYEGKITGETESSSIEGKIVWNFNDGETGGWYLEQGSNKSSLINFNGGKAIGLKSNYYSNNSAILKNNNILDIDEFNKYKTISYKVYIPNNSILDSLSFETYLSSGSNKVLDKFGENITSQISDFSITKDNRYYVINRTINRTNMDEDITESIFNDLITLNNTTYSGYLIVDSISLYNYNGVEVVDPDPGVIPVEGFNFSLTQNGGWGTTSAYNYSFENTSDITLTSWTIKIKFLPGSTVAGLWNAEYVMQDDTLVLTPPSWSGTFGPSSKVEGGMQISIPGTTPPYLDFEVISITGVTSDMEDVVIK